MFDVNYPHGHIVSSEKYRVDNRRRKKNHSDVHSVHKNALIKILEL